MSDRQPRRRTTAKSTSGSFAGKEHSAPEAQLGVPAPDAEVELYSSPDGAISLAVHIDGETVWATQEQMAALFDTSQRNVGVHLKNAYDEGELEEATRKDFYRVRREGSRDVTRLLLHYDLDAVISVGYRVHSPQGVHFRRWATGILRQRILDQNTARLRRMDQVTELLATSSDEQLASIGRIMQQHSGDLDRLADYDRGSLITPAETPATEAVGMDDVERIVAELRDRYPEDKMLGIAKDDSIHGVLGQIDQTFGGRTSTRPPRRRPRTCSTWW